MKTILFVSDAIYPYHKGGKEKRIFELSTRLAKAGHEVHVFTMNWWKGEIIKKENGVVLHGICQKINLYTNSRRSIRQAIYFSLKIIIPLLKTSFDIIDVDETPFFPVITCKLVCLIKRKKMVATWHEVWGKKYWQEYLGRKGYLAYLIEKYSTKLPNYFLAVSEFTQKRLIDFFHVPERKIRVIGNGIEIQKLENKLEKKYDVIFAGRLLDHKKVDIFIKSIDEARNEMPTIKAVIIGQGPEKDNLIKLVNQLNLKNNIVFYDFLTEEQFIQVILESRVFLSCSVREGFGIAVLEALAYGLPAIIIKHPENAATDLIKDQVNGFITQLDPTEISQKITSLLTDSRFYQKISSQALLNAKQYTWDRVVDRLITIYSLANK